MNDSNKILFDKFDVIKVLKKDQHAAVYLAHHIYLDKKIILKVLNTNTIGDKVIIKRFKREAKILAQLDSENIIKVLDFGMFKEFFYISFEYFPSSNLREVINENKLSSEQKEKLVVQLFEGLRIAHENNIIHRDIKPENILVNELLELKIGDFGLAEAANDSFATSQYSLVGTPSYMSPEQINGKLLTIKSDYFSAGIVVLELFTKSNPFLGKDINESINLITKFDESKTSFNLSGVPDKIKIVINNLLKKNSKDRYKNGEEISKSLGITIRVNKTSNSSERKKLKLYRNVIFLLSFAGFITLTSVFLFFPSNDSKKIETQNSKNRIKKREVIDQINSDSNIEKYDKFEIVENKKESKMGNLSSNKIGNNGIKLAEQKGELFVECIPWAEIYIDNSKVETTPLKKNIELLEGKYQLILRHPEYPEFVDSIEISKKKVTSFKVNLNTLFGYLDCKVFPWGNIYVDNIYKGETPLLKPIILEPKKHSVEIRNPQFETMKSIITITKGDTFRLVQNYNSIIN